MNQYEFMKNWCETMGLEPELHWPAAQREWDAAQRISGGGSPESTNRESGGTHQSPGSSEHIFKHIVKTNTLVSQLEGRIRIMDAQIQELKRTAK